MLRCFNALMLKCLMFQCRMYYIFCPPTQEFKNISVPLDLNSAKLCEPMFQCSYASILQCFDAQFIQCTNAKMSDISMSVVLYLLSTNARVQISLCPST